MTTKPDVRTQTDWAFEYDVHYHEAWYVGDELRRGCAHCGLDLTDEIHIRANENKGMARQRYAEAYARDTRQRSAEEAAREAWSLLHTSIVKSRADTIKPDKETWIKTVSAAIQRNGQ